MRPAEVRKHCELDDTCRSLMRTAMAQMQLSARAYHRVLKAGAHDRRPGRLRCDQPGAPG
jgi:predicted ATPase with chaperone activity